MAIDESNLTRGQLRKLNALRKSVGNKLGENVFSKWMTQQARQSAERRAAARRADPVAQKIVAALAGLADDPKVRLGNYGYTIRRTRGKGASGFVATKNARP